jgi:hypothetical protein
MKPDKFLTTFLLNKFCIALLFFSSCLASSAQTISIFYDSAIPQHEFAVKDIKTALEAKKFSVKIKSLSALTPNFKGEKVVIALASDAKIVEMLKAQGGATAPNLISQAYALRTTKSDQTSYWIVGGDANGAMYGALQLAENISFKGFGQTYNEVEAPHLKNRGIKFNIPLDRKSPTYYYSTDGTALKVALNHVWDMRFWQTWFDEMARNRYNVLSLWSPHPFTSMLNMEDEYPGIAIQGVTGFGKNDEEVLINKMTIDQKIKFWKQLMKYGRDRGFDIYFCTWNIFLSTAKDKFGITDKPDNPKTKVYLKKCMIKFLETYPDLAGFGITVGEHMGEIDAKQKEEWAWDTYGSGMMEYAKANPNRKLTFIHRQHTGGVTEIIDYFKPLTQLPNVQFDLSFKYSEAHAHTTVTPARWTKTKMEEGLGKNNLKSWLTVRNDDWYFLHWADPGFVRDYINHFPDVDQFVDGFYIGPDGWVFTNEFTSKDPYYKDKNALSIQRTWYMQKIWGRIGYNPAVSDQLFKDHLALKFPEVSADKLFEAWSNASASIRLANEEVTGEWDLDMDWWPEAWTGDAWKGKGHFMSVEDTRKTTPFAGSNLCSLSNTVKNACNGKISAVETVNKIEQLATNASAILSTLNAGSNTELKLTLKDLNAQAFLGQYNAWKFRSVLFLEQGLSLIHI